MTTRALRDAFSCFATGVAIVTTRWDAQDWGMTCSSFNTVSLDPPMVLWNIRRDATSHPAFVGSSGYLVNVLGSEHQALAKLFSKGQHHERFDGTHFLRTDSQRLRLPDAVAWFDCELRQVVRAGDHDILVAEVMHFGCRPGNGLVFQRSQFGAVGIASTEPASGPAPAAALAAGTPSAQRPSTAMA